MCTSFKNKTSLLQLCWNCVIVPLRGIALAFGSSTVPFRTFGLVFRLIRRLFGLFLLRSFPGRTFRLDFVLSSGSASGPGFVTPPWPAPGCFSGFLTGFVSGTTPRSLSVSSSGPASWLATSTRWSTSRPSLPAFIKGMCLLYLHHQGCTNYYLSWLESLLRSFLTSSVCCCSLSDNCFLIFSCLMLSS